MTSRALTRYGFRPSATWRIVMSRSVRVPMTRLPSQIGKKPTSSNRISSAASLILVSGSMHSTLRLMISLTFMTEFPPTSIDVEYSPEIAGLRYAALELLINLATLILLVDSPLGGAPVCHRRAFSFSRHQRRDGRGSLERCEPSSTFSYA